MKIIDVKATLHERTAPQLELRGSSDGRALMSVVRIITDEGIEGNALLGSCIGWGDTLGEQVVRHLKPILLGRDPFDVGSIWKDMWLRSRVADTHAIGAADVALWDIMGKAAGLPVHRLLGTHRTSAPAYFASWWYKDSSTYIDEALHYQSLGWRGYKVHPFGDAKRDIELARQVRDAVGDNMSLMLDPYCAYTYEEAVHVAEAIHDLGYLWLEDPLGAHDLYGYSKLREKVDIPILATELTPGSFMGYSSWISERGTDILRGDVGVKAGITPMIKIAHLAESFGMTFEIHESYNALNNTACLNVNMAAGSGGWVEVVSPDKPGHFTLETYNYGVLNPIQVVDGEVAAPTEPGLGCQLDWEMFNRTQIGELS